MSREIKFRAWNKKTKSMIIEVWEIGLGSKNNPEKWLIGDDKQTDNFELMQFTGLKDSKGNDIYEGDIIEFDRNEWGGDDNIHLVTWCDEDGQWCLGGGSVSGDVGWRTVIGNIHTTPELLKP